MPALEAAGNRTETPSSAETRHLPGTPGLPLIRFVTVQARYCVLEVTKNGLPEHVAALSCPE